MCSLCLGLTAFSSEHGLRPACSSLPQLINSRSQHGNQYSNFFPSPVGHVAVVDCHLPDASCVT